MRLKFAENARHLNDLRLNLRSSPEGQSDVGKQDLDGGKDMRMETQAEVRSPVHQDAAVVAMDMTDSAGGPRMAPAAQQGVASCLLVDDNTFDRCMLRRCLARERPGLQLFEAETIGGARDVLTRRTPDLILLDHRLPDGQGASLARELRADPTFDRTLICVVSNTDPRLLDPEVLAVSKDDLTPSGLWSLLDAFQRDRDAEEAEEGAGAGAVQEAGLAGRIAVDAEAAEAMSAAVSRMLRTLRRARTSARRVLPRDARNDLEKLEEMLLAFSEMVERR